MSNPLRVLRITAVCIFLVFSFYGCASRPDEQLKLATDAMNQAIDLGAEQYVPGDWKGAKELWDQAQDQLSKQQYAAATESLLRAKARFLKVVDAAKMERETIHKQVTDIQSNIQGRYAAFKSMKVPPAAKKDYQAALTDIEKRIGTITSLMDQGGFIEAKAAALGTLQAIEYNEKKLQGGAVAR